MRPSRPGGALCHGRAGGILTVAGPANKEDNHTVFLERAFLIVRNGAQKHRVCVPATGTVGDRGGVAQRFGSACFRQLRGHVFGVQLEM